MKKLGLIGGMGPQSTVPYYMNIVYGVQQRTSPDFFPNVAIESLNVFEILKMIETEKYDELTNHFLTAINNLKASGVEIAALTANTAHIVFDKLSERSPVPLISIVRATVDEALCNDYATVGLLGTRFTMERDFYKDAFVKSGIKVIVPDEKERVYIDEKISTELEFGIVRHETQQRFASIVERMRTHSNIQAVILGCTELPLILNDKIVPIPCLDTVKIHSDTLIDAILS